jgi:DNA invertase Pin-like site-specific DNA recombinase
MAGQRIGYIRVSTLDQQTERQLDGIALDQSFTQGSRMSRVAC